MGLGAERELPPSQVVPQHPRRAGGCWGIDATQPENQRVGAAPAFFPSSRLASDFSCLGLSVLIRRLTQG